MLAFTPDVRITYFDSRLWTVLASACVWSVRARVDVRVFCVDENPLRQSGPALLGYALDVKLWPANDRRADAALLAGYLRAHLDPHFEVIEEALGVLVNYDGRRPQLPRRIDA